jgi:hypothetical protein
MWVVLCENVRGFVGNQTEQYTFIEVWERKERTESEVVVASRDRHWMVGAGGAK